MDQQQFLRMGLVGLGLAHELNGPLTSAALALELLNERLAAGTLSVEDTQAEIGRVLDNVRRMGALVHHLRDLARHETRHQESVALDDVVDRAFTLGRPAVAVFADVEVQRGPRHAAARARVDPLLLEQALLCLILNGVEATGSGTVRVDVVADGIDIVDEGPGFAGSDPAAPDPIAPGRTTKATGMGVGLSLARLIVNDVGGTLEVSNRSKGGGVVRLRFPILAA